MQLLNGCGAWRRESFSIIGLSDNGHTRTTRWISLDQWKKQLPVIL